MIEKPMLGLLDIIRKYKSLRLPLDSFFSISNKIMVRKHYELIQILAKILYNRIKQLKIPRLSKDSYFFDRGLNQSA